MERSPDPDRSGNDSITTEEQSLRYSNHLPEARDFWRCGPMPCGGSETLSRSRARFARAQQIGAARSGAERRVGG